MSRRRKPKTNTAPVLTADTFSNPLFRLGRGSQSPLEATEYPLTRMTGNYALLSSLYRDNWVVQNVVGIIPDDMTKNWFTLSGVDPEHQRTLDRVQRETALRARINTGLKWGRLYGGAAGILLIRGHEGLLDQPLDVGTVLPGSFQGLYVLDRWCGVTPGAETVLIRGEEVPAYYQVTGPGGGILARVHHSRVIRFTGRELPYLEKLAEMYWGESEIEALYQDVVKHDNVSANMAALTFRANVDTMEVENLDQLFSLASGEAQRRFWNTVQAQSVMRSNFGYQLVNKGDQITNTQYTFTGLQEVYDSMCHDLSGASRIPVTKLFGRSPAGLNSTGEGDLRNYYDYVDTLRENILRPILERLLPVVCMSAWGEVPEELDIRFPPLWTPTAKEVAEIGEKKAAAIRDIFQAGLLRADTAQKELKKLADETGLFGNLSDEEIAANAGKTYQDVTALRDPLAGLGYETGGIGAETGDILALDYKGQPREKNGRFTYGKLSGGSTGKKKRGKISPVRMSKKEIARVSSGILTDHPQLKPGDVSSYLHGKYFYKFTVKGPGDYRFTKRMPIVGNETYINSVMKGQG